ncbi:hypothetical protein BpHYR1_016461 [Brachionus plicatilis]|uniref:Uncharacterized protein n=1 Tax=Brachionus plicatilis TaxID=10195 RepID=A0A3M7RZG2_BRAPC|nr:hypothetical protein BpHYR1_016461 [Brachionus plicatilis]
MGLHSVPFLGTKRFTFSRTTNLNSIQFKTNFYISFPRLFLDFFFSSSLPEGKMGKGKVEKESNNKICKT